MSILTLPSFLVNFDFAAIAPLVEADDHRPTAGPDFTPTAEEEAEAAEPLNEDDFGVRTDDEWEAMANDAHALDVVCSGFSWMRFRRGPKGPLQPPRRIGTTFQKWLLVSVQAGNQGPLVRDEHGFVAVYMVCEPSIHYYRIMTCWFEYIFR